jgi:hypothetical protein
MPASRGVVLVRNYALKAGGGEQFWLSGADSWIKRSTPVPFDHVLIEARVEVTTTLPA